MLQNLDFLCMLFLISCLTNAAQITNLGHGHKIHVPTQSDDKDNDDPDPD